MIGMAAYQLIARVSRYDCHVCSHLCQWSNGNIILAAAYLQCLAAHLSSTTRTVAKVDHILAGISKQLLGKP